VARIGSPSAVTTSPAPTATDTTVYTNPTTASGMPISTVPDLG